MRYYKSRFYDTINTRYILMQGQHILELDSTIPDDVAENMTLKDRVLKSKEVVKYPTTLEYPSMLDLRTFVNLHNKYDADWQVLIDLGVDEYNQFFPNGLLILEITAIKMFISEHPRFVDALKFTLSSDDPSRIRKLAIFARRWVTPYAERGVRENDSTLRLKNHLKFILAVAEGGVQ